MDLPSCQNGPPLALPSPMLRENCRRLQHRGLYGTPVFALGCEGSKVQFDPWWRDRHCFLAKRCPQAGG